MTIKLSKTRPPYNQYKPSDLQKKQWQQVAALGYSIAIRGYLQCWRAILVRANMADELFIWNIDNILEVSRLAEKRARWNLKHLRSLK